jgi:hypothetical protein
MVGLGASVLVHIPACGSVSLVEAIQDHSHDCSNQKVYGRVRRRASAADRLSPTFPSGCALAGPSACRQLVGRRTIMSFKPEVIADSSGKWSGNALRFATGASDTIMRRLTPTAERTMTRQGHSSPLRR